MVEDVVKSLGYLCLGTRMRRIGEELQAQTQQIIDTSISGVSASQFPFLAAIDRLGELTIGELAEAVGVTQPGTTKVVKQLQDAGYIEVRPASDDQRKRLVCLSPEGRCVIDKAGHELWPLVEAAVTELCANLDAPLLDQLGRIEDELHSTSLLTRVEARRRKNASA